MATEHRGGVSWIAGLASPGPTYALPSACFTEAAKKPKTQRPTWGPPPTHESQKIARARTEELKFIGRDFLGELRGHFSPGPQYMVPGQVGGAPANRFASEVKLQRDRVKYTGMAPAILNATGRTTLDASSLGGEPVFSLTAGSFCDPTRAPQPNEDTSATYWRQSTMLQTGERSVTTPYHTYSRRTEVTPAHMPWTEEGNRAPCYGLEVQDLERAKLQSRARPTPDEPYRNLQDAMADPPHANVFGPLKSRTDYGKNATLGGLDRGWRESKVSTNNTVGTWFGPPPKSTGKLRCAFVQHMGPNAVPRGVPHADMEGGRITKYAVERPQSSAL